MTTRLLYCNTVIGGTPIDVLSVEVNEGHKQTTARFSLETEDITGLNLNQTVTIDLGFVGSHGQVFVGYVDEIAESAWPGVYTISGRDVLKRAIEHYIVTTDLEHPWSRENIDAAWLVRDLLKEAGITNYIAGASSFDFGTSHPAEFNLMSVWDAITQICNILAYNCWAENGTVYFARVFPVPTIPAPPLSKHFDVGTAGNIEVIDYQYNTDNLRNKVVVFGREGIYAARQSNTTPCAGNPAANCTYLPAGFFKTAIVSSEMIDTHSMADSSAQYNLVLYNKLTESLRLEAEGDYTVRCRDTVTVTEPFTGMSNDPWFVYSITHRIDTSGYKLVITLSR